MRTFETHKVMYTDLDYPELMIKWGTGPRRKRVRPRALTVSYRRKHGEGWELGNVYMGCDRVHKTAKFGLGVFLYDFGTEKHPIPEWAYGLIAAASPVG